MPRSRRKSPPKNPAAGELLIDMASPAVRRVLVGSLIAAIMAMILIATLTLR